MRLVLCDDHVMLLEALAAALPGNGFTVEAAVTTPEQAVRAVGLYDPDILLVDVAFPSGSGIDAATKVLAHHPRTKVVMITGNDSAQPLLDAMAIGVSGYLRKDQPLDEIAGALERVCRNEAAIDPGLLRRLATSSRRTRPRTALSNLTARERQVLDLLAAGHGTDDIMATLEVSQSTVRTHVQNIFSKLGVHSRVQAVALVDRALWTGGEHDDLRSIG